MSTPCENCGSDFRVCISCDLYNGKYIEIPDNATNGEVIKAMFPYGKYNEYFTDVEMKTEENDTRFKSVFDRDWWNEPYQKGGANEE